MNARLSKHALAECSRRGITPSEVEAVLADPDQTVPGLAGKIVCQSVQTSGGQSRLLRVIVAMDVDPPLVVTVYRTTKVAKYWSQS